MVQVLRLQMVITGNDFAHESPILITIQYTAARQYGMLSPYGMDQKRVRKRLAQLQVWHAGDVSALPDQGEACVLAGVTRARQARHLSACIRK